MSESLPAIHNELLSPAPLDPCDPLPAAPQGEGFRPFPSDRPRVSAGEALLLGERYEEAIPFLLDEYHRDPTGPLAYQCLSNLGICFRIAGRYLDSVNAFSRALMLDPSSAVVWMNFHLTLVDLGEHDAAFRASQNAIRLAQWGTPTWRDIVWTHSTALLREGLWREGWALWEDSRRGFMDGQVAQRVPIPRWRSGPLRPGTRMLVFGEWGFGDILLMFRYLGLLKSQGCHVTYAVWPGMRPLFEGHPWIDSLVEFAFSEGSVTRLDSDDYDLCVPVMSLPYAFHHMPSDIPFPDARLIPPGLSRPAVLHSSRRRIGICWQAGESAFPFRFRSYLPAQISALQSVNADWYSLNQGAAPDWMTPLPSGSWLDTAHLIESLDLVVTVDTAVAHLSALMGKPTWLMLPAASDWKWLRNRPTTVWYDTMRLFRSDTPDAFLGIPEQIAKELR